MSRVRRAVAALLGSVLLVSGCADDPAPPPAPLGMAWQELRLPPPAGVAGAAMVRDAAVCDGRWFVVGAVRDAAGGTTPAAWSSTDGSAWTPMRTDARSYYGRQNVLSSVACQAGRMAALGGKVGGAHGNPRTSSWYAAGDGVLHEVLAPFVLFGGSEAVNVSRLDAGPRGFLISGNRVSGAAVWRSPDASEFELIERAPQLAADPSGETWAFDAVAVPDGWLVVGGWLAKGRVDRDVMGWRSADGRSWQRLAALAPTPAYEELQQVAMAGTTPVAVGLRGGSFGAWRLAAGGWEQVGTFGSVRPTAFSGVRSLVAQGDRLFCVTSDGDAYALWDSADGGRNWRPVALPAPMAARAETSVAVSGDGSRLLLVSDDSEAGRIYTAETPG
ncbi:hypothetical protein [Jidongwangia harbinensis]|uniref:hypothetical protein n=1 Tax=Jidongwangia harbinensis TaxID=2878561 RepID=UPI001CD93A64|nr:hypothetical protein [Jidongwangia harbinensis]MCA2212321.1 hypothetical protein [Jidongwangia harbinensis]